MKTLQDYIKLAEQKWRTTDETVSLIQSIPAMAKALIEAEAALKASMLTMKNHRIHAPDTLSLQKTALATIQSLQENKNDAIAAQKGG